MLGTLDFTGSEHWAPFNFLWSTALLTIGYQNQYVVKVLYAG